MPTFEYQCPKCNKVVEDEASDAKIKCSCDGRQSPYLLRSYTFGGVQFKGTGFYKTDNREKK